MVLWLIAVKAQEPDSIVAKPGKVDIDFLFGYYQQEGDNSVVTGGQGTEELSDYNSEIKIHVVLDTVSDLNITGGINYYTSASSDKIDFVVSSASKADYHAHLKVGYSKKLKDSRLSVNVEGGGAVESDYISGHVSIGISKLSSDRNRLFSIGVTSYFDTWQLIFPDELRSSGAQFIETDKRRSIIVQGLYSFLISKRLKASFSAGLTIQQGLLSTPFHRVYFNDAVGSGMELLPNYRLRVPLSVRLHQFAGYIAVIRYFYRIYADSWGILGNTASIEVSFKVNHSFSIYPFYRFHQQIASVYFEPFSGHSASDKFRTSDYDLSGFLAHKAGLGIQWAPSSRTIDKRNKKPKHQIFKSLNLRGSLYMRSDGLSAFMVSGNVGFRF